MNLLTMIAVLLISLLFTMVFVVGLKSRGPWGSGWTFFSIVCLWLAAVSLWIPPAGPVWIGVPWIDLIVTALLVSFVLSATSIDRSSSRSSQDTFPPEKTEPLDKPVKSDMSKEVTRKEVSAHAKAHKGKKIRGINYGTTNYAVTQVANFDSAQTWSAHETLAYKGQALHAGGFFWMLLLCLCALIIMGAH